MELIDIIKIWIMQVYYGPFLSFLSYERLPSLMQTVGLALLTLLLPFGVGILGGFFSKQKSSVAAYYELDLNVIVSTVIPFKKLVCAVGLVFVPALLWETAGSALEFVALRLGILILWAIGIYLLVFILKDIFAWIRGEEYTLRFEYLRKNKPTNPKVWDSIWRVKNENQNNIVKFFSLFTERIQALIKHNKILDASNLMSSFAKSLPEESIKYYFFDKILQALLEWHYIITQHYYSEDGMQPQYMPLKKNIENCIHKIIAIVLSSQAHWIYLSTLFEELENFAEQKLKEAQGRKYIENHFIAMIAPTIFEHVKYFPDTQDNWSDYFPQKWKIKAKMLLHDKNIIIPKLWLHMFLWWAKKRIVDHNRIATVKPDEQLEELLKGLFIDVDNETWAIILTFAFTPSSSTREKLRMLIEKDLRFGLTLRETYIPEADFKKWQSNRQQEWNNAIELALNVNQFVGTFSRDKLLEYIRELDLFSYEDDKSVARKKQISQIFEHMLRLSDKKEAAE